MLSTAWSSSKKICPLSKRPPRYCWHIPKILWKRPVYPDYFFSCDYDANKHQSFCKLALSFLMEVTRHVQNTLNRNLAVFLEYIKKKLLQLLLSSFWCKTFRYFTRIQQCSLLLIDLSLFLLNASWGIYWIPRKSKYAAVFLSINNKTQCVFVIEIYHILSIFHSR